jgi:hypothetical protein
MKRKKEEKRSYLVKHRLEEEIFTDKNRGSSFRQLCL